MRSVAYGLSALSPGVGAAEDFIEKKGIPDDQVPAFLAKFGDPQLAGLIAQKQRLKEIQAKMPPPGGPQSAPPTVKDDINMQVMRALNPTPNNPQPQAGGQPPQGGQPGQPGMPPQGGPPPGGPPQGAPQGGPPPGGPPVQAAAGGLMGYGIGGLDAGAMEAPRHFDGGGVVAFATGGPGYKNVTDTATAQHEADLAGVPMDKRWTDAKEAEWRRYKQMETDINTSPTAKNAAERPALNRAYAAIKPRYDQLTDERNAALDRQQNLYKTTEEKTLSKYGIASPSTPIAPPSEDIGEEVPDDEAPNTKSSSSTSSTASSPGTPQFNFKNDELYNDVKSAHEKVSSAWDQLYKDVKEAKPSLLEEDTEALAYKKDTADIKLAKAQEKYAEAKGYGARKKGLDQAMYDAQRGMGTSSIFWRGISAWRDAKQAAEDAKETADNAYRDQIQAVLDAKQTRKDENTKESQTFYKAQLEKLGTVTLNKAQSDELHEKTLGEIRDKDIGRQIDAYNAQSQRVSSNASMINATTNKQMVADSKEQQMYNTAAEKMATASDKFRASLEASMQYTPEQIDTKVSNYEKDYARKIPILNKYGIQSTASVSKITKIK
jgi:hypothetical protein